MQRLITKENCDVSFPFPCALFCDRFKEMSLQAKIAYMLLSNRKKLSIKNKNKFSDAQGNVYVIFRNEEMGKYLNLAPRTIKTIMRELRNYGLVSTVQPRIGAPSRIYVKDIKEFIEFGDEQELLKTEKQELIDTMNDINPTEDYISAIDDLRESPSFGMGTELDSINEFETSEGNILPPRGNKTAPMSADIAPMGTEKCSHVYRKIPPATIENKYIERNTEKEGANNIYIDTQEKNSKFHSDSLFGEETEKKPQRKRFTPPTREEVQAYIEETNGTIDADAFIDYYEVRGWKLKGNVTMKNWKAAVRTWERNNKKGNGNSRYQKPKNFLQEFEEKQREQGVQDWLDLCAEKERREKERMEQENAEPWTNAY